MNLLQLWCSLTSLGNHHEPSNLDFGDHYCIKCNRYLYTIYDPVASLKNMRNAWKMWWEIKE